MKKLTLYLVFLSGFLQAQVAIEKSAITNTSVSLEFGNVNKAIVLPWVNSTAEVEAKGVVPGSLVFDAADKKVKWYREDPNFPGQNWFDFTADESGAVDPSLQTPLEEKPDAKVIIGNNPSTDSATNGILILGDTNKAMILPKVASPHLNIINPQPGMIVYDTNTKFVMTYNGTVWSFWRPEVF